MRKPRKGSTTTYVGVRAYYRRTLKSGQVRLYLRDAPNRVVGSITVEPDKAALFKRGKTYTIEHIWS